MARWVAIALVVVACSRSDSGDSKQWQTSPPPDKIDVPDALTIAVEVDGAARPPITAATLRTIKPDFVDTERRAWLVPTLVADAAPPGTTVEAIAPSGVSLKVTHPTGDGLEPVLFLTRRGEVIVSTIDPKDPFPQYHGRGGRLHRAGDSQPHLAPVAKLAITHPRP
ncbi:MAG TPA: hypothetical protein VLX92_16450 [Kofleriaceae bacterium]|nr:hypothetical protein [Kofleriaceae bacterium]